MEEKERYSWYNHSTEEIYDNKDDIVFVGAITVLNQQNRRIWELIEENKQLKDQVKKSYQEGLLQKQFDKDMEIQELKDKIEFLTTFKKVISEHKPAFCKLAGRDCEWLGKEKQLAISELEKLKVQCQFDITFADYVQEQRLYDYIDNQIKELGGGENDK